MQSIIKNKILLNKTNNKLTTSQIDGSIICVKHIRRDLWKQLSLHW